MKVSVDKAVRHGSDCWLVKRCSRRILELGVGWLLKLEPNESLPGKEESPELTQL